ncbi:MULTISPECIES: alpha/beta hydrolase [Ramlibacter]|uniref:Alpha/beta hydrolase n=1 Tax=Ramlibacter aquaticus TaxID=2780094 RepID=A0ABR9SG58_9BURK|nr:MULTISPECIES: alpha/beta hydrolase [Ramlibacter]MBE7941338.1 alpha/beta hydrolase [Ramlibacter aquaticus]
MNTAPAPVPLAFDSAAGPCFGWYHPPADNARDTVVVMCPALGYEASCAYQSWTRLAGLLAAAGLPVLRFDWHGSGDSAGDDRLLRLDDLRASVDAAMAEARRLSGCTRVALLGLRMGAMLALDAAARAGGVEAVAAWAPCTGKGFARELRALAMARGELGGTLEAQGLACDEDALRDLQGLAPATLPHRPAARVLLVARDDLGGAETLFESALRSRGCHVTLERWPGYARAVAEPTHPVDLGNTLGSLAGWLAERAGPAASTPPRPHVSSQLQAGAAIEQPWRFGTDGRLFGILARPSAGGAAPGQVDTAVLLLNVGGNPRTGPHRLYVTLSRALAASGLTVLRLDVAGIGDSPGEFPHTAAMWQRATADVRAAMDSLQPLGLRRFQLVGICSGSYLALETALVDERVCRQVLGNTRVLEYDTGSAPWQGAMQRHYKSMRYYGRALARAGVWRRLLRGQVDARGIAARAVVLAQARMSRGLARLLGRGPARDSLCEKFLHLSRRGTRTLIVMSEQDDGLDYLDFHLGRNAAHLRGEPGFELQLVPGADHTFSTQAMQQRLVEILRQEMLACPAEDEAATVLQARVAHV